MAIISKSNGIIKGTGNPNLNTSIQDGDDITPIWYIDYANTPPTVYRFDDNLTSGNKWVIDNTITSADDVPVTPNGNLSSTDLQSALEEHQSDIDNILQDEILYKISIAELRASTDTHDFVYIIDNGQTGVFKYDSTDVSSADNTGTILVASNGRRYKRQFDGYVNVKWFGAKGDGVTDDTTSVHTAFDVTISVGKRLFLPTGIYRLTAGYTTSINFKDLSIIGEIFNREGDDVGGSILLLDSTDPLSFFLNINSRCDFLCSEIEFRSNQYIANREFIKISGSLVKFTISNSHFTNVEKPIVFKSGTYLQSCSADNLEFNKSGTFHSDSNTLIGTLLLLNNVHHEGTVPENTEKVLCDFSGFRNIQASNFLLEGSLPNSGWTILKLNTPNSTSLGNFHNFWSEWSLNPPTYVVDQVGSAVNFFDSHLGLNPSGTKYKLSSSAKLSLYSTPVVGYSGDIATMFEFENRLSKLTLIDSRVRGLDLTNPNVSYINCTDTTHTQSVISNMQPVKLIDFDGGYWDNLKNTSQNYGGTSQYPSVDSVYGRKLVIVPNGDSFSNYIGSTGFGDIKNGDVITVFCKGKLPLFTSGSIRFFIASSLGSSSLYNAKLYDSSYSGLEFEFNYMTRITSDYPVLSFGIHGLSTSGVSGNLEFYSLQMFKGYSTPNTYLKQYPKNIVTYNTSAPTLGEWTRGDIVYNTLPSASGTIGWVCVTSGTPGTWKTFGSISA